MFNNIKQVATDHLSDLYHSDERVAHLLAAISSAVNVNTGIVGLQASAFSYVLATLLKKHQGIFVIVKQDKDSAAYTYNDIENIFHEQTLPLHKKKVVLFPASQHNITVGSDHNNIMLRTDVINKIKQHTEALMIITYPEAIIEKTVQASVLQDKSIRLNKGEQVNIDFILDLLVEYNFERVDFVVEPGQFAVRGGIIDIYSFANENPYRIEFFGNEVESIRSFDPVTQLSVSHYSYLSIVPNLHQLKEEKLVHFFENLPASAIIGLEDKTFMLDVINDFWTKSNSEEKDELTKKYIEIEEYENILKQFKLLDFRTHKTKEYTNWIEFDIRTQVPFNKNFNLLFDTLKVNSANGLKNIIVAEQPRQLERLNTILQDLSAAQSPQADVNYHTIRMGLHAGFMDMQLKIACFTDHQIFERYHRFHLREGNKGKQALTLKEIYNLKKGDFITHIDHGVGVFDGLESLDVNGRQQEAIRLLYKDNDILYISIHALHRISKFVGSEGTPPPMHRLGSNAWNRVKEKTKARVKDIAKDLIKLYAQRRNAQGFAFAPDTYLQHELEASFIYEDTPDQIKATRDVKKDMEAEFPMDRLICGDVGFGKTEIALRAAFKSVTDSKQVAVLVPTTILALQHYKTFKHRLKDLPCTVDFINRFKSTKQQKEVLQKTSEGKVDILIGTHRLLSKDVKFKDLGLLIVDEEQKFGVAAKEKLKQFKVNVDTLTLTATPIPRTLQFSLMGARDLSVINTPPANRYPIQTELHGYNEDVMRSAIEYELSRGGQVFVVYNRVQNIEAVADMVRRLVPKAKVAIGHGQMDGAKLEEIMIDFIDGDYDVLVATTIIESGLDISNANTMIIYDAQNFGLSDLHQLRGRVGRSNCKAFCYLIAPSALSLSDEARKRLKAIVEFADLGSGFNIAMRDLDIRGAGNILGGEQSGFIAEVGYETYLKILDEALQELKQNEFKELYADTGEPTEHVRDCQIETDFEILIPPTYVDNVTERISLYKELDNAKTEEDLQRFEVNLTDRFGPIPRQTMELMKTIRMRWLAKKAGFEKVIIKKNRMIGSFVSNQESSYYQSEMFNKVLHYVQLFPHSCKMKQGENKLSLIIDNIHQIDDATAVFTRIME